MRGSTADTTAINVYNYAISRGNCDEFADAGAIGRRSASSSDAASIEEIRDNYGLDCNGVRLPATRADARTR